MITRIITAVIGIVLAVGIITTGGWLFGAAVLALGLLAWFEFKRMAESKGWHVYTCTGGGAVALLLALAAYAFGIKMEHLSLYPFLLFLVVLFFLLITFEGLLSRLLIFYNYHVLSIISSVLLALYPSPGAPPKMVSTAVVQNFFFRNIIYLNKIRIFAYPH